LLCQLSSLIRYLKKIELLRKGRLVFSKQCRDAIATSQLCSGSRGSRKEFDDDDSDSGRCRTHV
jgi:hypothetical protein